MQCIFKIVFSVYLRTGYRGGCHNKMEKKIMVLGTDGCVRNGQTLDTFVAREKNMVLDHGNSKLSFTKMGKTVGGID